MLPSHKAVEQKPAGLIVNFIGLLVICDWLHSLSQKNVPTLASCSFDKHGLILIIFGQHHQHTFRNDMHV